MYLDGREVEACCPRVSLPSLLCVGHSELQVLRRIRRHLSEYVAHARYLVASVAAVVVIRIVRRARACRWIASEPSR